MKKRIFAISTGIVFLILLDQSSKYMAQKYLEYSQNTGIAFGISLPQPILIIFSLILIAVIPYIFFKELKHDEKISQLALMLIISGAIGNLIDRFTHGFVVDFISVWKWPDFNLADTYISIGILLMIIFYDNMTRSERK